MSKPTLSLPKPKCKTCKYAETVPLSESTLNCHRWPPNAVRWPVVMLDDWCGEWEKAK